MGITFAPRGPGQINGRPLLSIVLVPLTTQLNTPQIRSSVGGDLSRLLQDSPGLAVAHTRLVGQRSSLPGLLGTSSLCHVWPLSLAQPTPDSHAGLGRALRGRESAPLPVCHVLLAKANCSVGPAPGVGEAR